MGTGIIYLIILSYSFHGITLLLLIAAQTIVNMRTIKTYFIYFAYNV